MSNEQDPQKQQDAAALFGAMEYGPAPEDNKQALAWLDKHKDGLGHFINGKFVKAKGKSKIDVTNPATGETLSSIKSATKGEVDSAVQAAHAAQKTWAALPGYERAKKLYALERAIQRNSRLFAVLESMDNGKTIRETRDIDVALAARHYNYHAGYAQLMDTEFDGLTPYGVAGQIIPWNFPLLMMAWKVAPALATGNTVVLKPAEQTPLTAMLFAEICKDAGIPDGVVNIVNGDGKTGSLIVNHDGIDKLAFTGSTDVGRIIREASAGTGKGLTLELGGKSPFIVFEDADIDSAIEGVVDAIWFNQGEVCCGGSRLLVQEGVYDKFIEKLKSRMAKLRVGDPLDKSMDMGSVVDRTQWNRINGMVSDAAESGAEVFQLEEPCEDGGCFYPPTLITNVQSSDTVMQEEIFGPVISAMTFRTHDEAVSLANNTSYGLAASIWSENIDKCLEVAPRVKAGVIWINGTNYFDASVGFGGYKESGYGREGGREGMMAYLKPASEKNLPGADVSAPVREYDSVDNAEIDQTPKMYIGGKQARPDSGYCDPVVNQYGVKIGEIGQGNRKDIRNAVEAARGAAGFAASTGHNRAQIIRFIAENLSKRKGEFSDRLQQLTGCTSEDAQAEVQQSLQALFNFAAWADKNEGPVHQPPGRFVVASLNEPVGIIGMSCPNEKPLLSMVTMMAAAISQGNRVVMTPSEKYPLLATDFYQVLDTSDVPAGVVNFVTGSRDELADTLSKHEEVDAHWYHGSVEGSQMVEANSAHSNLKQTWTNVGKAYDWNYLSGKGAKELLGRATQVKNVWVPYGEGIGPK